MNTSGKAKFERLCLTAVLAFALFWFYLLQHLAFQNGRLYADEEIVLALVRHIAANHTLDTNWSRVDEIFQNYPNDQFNFSSAVLFYRFVGRILQPLVSQPFAIYELRLAAVLCSAIAIPLFYLAFRRLAGAVTALIAVAVTFFSYQTVTESLQARPEAFVLMVFAGGLLASVEAGLRSGWKRFALIAIAGICVGLLVASKFSLIVCLGLFGGVIVLLKAPASPVMLLRSAAISATLMLPAAAAGLFIGAPYAFFDPPAALEGAQVLMNQYGGVHLPYGRADSDLLGRLAHGMSQLASHMGWFTLIAAAIGFLVTLQRRQWALVMLISVSSLLCLYFLQSPVFFERNYSFLIPVIGFSAALGVVLISNAATKWIGPKAQGPVLAGIAAVALIQPGIATWFVAAAVRRDSDRDAEREHALANASAVLDADTDTDWGPSWPDETQLKQFVDKARSGSRKLYYFGRMNDPYSGRTIERLIQVYGFAEVLHKPADLARFPQSMIHFNFDLEYSLLLFDPTGTSHNTVEASRPLKALGDVCFGKADSISVSGGFKTGALDSSVSAPVGANHVRGSWLGGDEAQSDLTFTVSGPPGSWVVPVLSGPGKAGQRISVAEGLSEPAVYRISTNQFWLALEFHSPGGEFSLRASDEGARWGEWMALGDPAPVVDCNALGAGRLPTPADSGPAARFALWP